MVFELCMSIVILKTHRKMDGNDLLLTHVHIVKYITMTQKEQSNRVPMSSDQCQ